MQVLDVIFELLGNIEGNLDVDSFLDLLNRKDMAYSKEHVSTCFHFFIEALQNSGKEVHW